MKKWILNNRLILTGAILGGIGGYCYYRLIGCTNGSCLISSKPLNSSIYFAFLGAIIFSLFRKKTGNEAK